MLILNMVRLHIVLTAMKYTVSRCAPLHQLSLIEQRQLIAITVFPALQGYLCPTASTTTAPQYALHAVLAYLTAATAIIPILPILLYSASDASPHPCFLRQTTPAATTAAPIQPIAQNVKILPTAFAASLTIFGIAPTLSVMLAQTISVAARLAIIRPIVCHAIVLNYLSAAIKVAALSALTT